MDDRTKKHLKDIQIAVAEIDLFLEDVPRQFESFTKDLRLRRAVERDIEIIGEAMNRILKEEGQIKITDARKIVGARNYIIHGYDSLSPEILWSIIIKHLPLLKKEVNALLDENQ